MLAGLNDKKRQLELAHQCITLDYSVRKLEELVKDKPKESTPKRTVKTISPELNALQNSMREALGLKTVLNGTESKGKITLSYNSAEELEHLYEVIGRLLV